METFGEYLRTQREKKGIRLEEIASITKIHLHSLQHLEKGLWKELPPEPFIRGFIIAYAKYVGLEPKDVLERYALEQGKSNPQSYELGVVTTSPDVSENKSAPFMNVPPAQRVQDNPDEVLRNPRTLPIRKIAFASIGVVFLLAIGLLVSLGKEKVEPTQTATVETPATAKEVAKNETATPSTASTPERNVSSSAETTASTTAPTQPAPAETKPVLSEFAHEVSVETKERSWAKIVIDDKAPVEFYSEPGKPVSYQAKEKIKLVLGNAAGSTVTHNGEKSEGKRYNGTIRYYVFPFGARFPQDIPKRKEASVEQREEASPAESKQE